MKDPRATREAFGQALVSAGERDERIVALDGDVATSVFTHLFAEKFPDRYFQVGIAESNMVGIAAGLAQTGKIPFAASFACFVVGRFETIRMSVAYNRSNVKIVGTHVGVGIGPDGHSQMGLEDVALMRTLPNMVVVQPSTGTQTEAALDTIVEHVGPAYLRLTRQKLPELYEDDYTFQLGKGHILREGGDVAIIASGATVHEALKAAGELEKAGISAAVADMPSIAPLDDDLVAELASQCGKIVTVEDHTPVGGLGGAVCESLAARRPAPVLRIGVEGFGESGDPDELYDRFGLSGHKVAAAVAGFCESAAEIALLRS